MDELAGKGLYVYCFFKGKKLLCPPVKGVDPDYELFSLPYGQISAALSPVSIEEYGDGPLSNNQQELSWIVPRIQAHNRVIEAITASRSVIPLRFGTVFNGPERIVAILKANYSVFLTFFKYIKDKEEWGVKVYADAKQAQEVVSPPGFTAKAFDKGGTMASSGRAYLLKKKKELSLKEEVYEAFGAISDEIYTSLAAYALSGCRNKLLDLSPRVDRREMILNAAFLVAKNQTDHFKKQVWEMALAYDARGLLFEVNGPWPPYSFCPPVKYPAEEGLRK